MMALFHRTGILLGHYWNCGSEDLTLIRHLRQRPQTLVGLPVYTIWKNGVYFNRRIVDSGHITGR